MTRTRPLVHSLGSLAGVTMLALLAPLAIVVIGLPIALAARAIIELVRWLAP